ncbi:MAG: YczE/YyaS/YitT family protein [Acidimicrobiia bacterium]
MSKYLIAAAGERLSRRLTQLIVGLVLFGVGIGLMLQSGLGVPPWDVLHQGLARHFGLTVGIWSIIVSALVLLLWLPLRQPYGLGTLLNAVIIGVVIDLTGVVIPEPISTAVAWVMLLAGIVLIGIASGLYIGANLGPGPRDGLMTGIARKGPSIRLTRAVIEITALSVGWMLGGTFGLGTVVFALAIGPLVQFFLLRWNISPRRPIIDPLDHPAR